MSNVIQDEVLALKKTNWQEVGEKMGWLKDGVSAFDNEGDRGDVYIPLDNHTGSIPLDNNILEVDDCKIILED